MDALGQSGELIRRSNALRARSRQARVTAAEKIEESRQLIAAAHEVQKAVTWAHGWAGRDAGGTADGLPREGRAAALSGAFSGW